MYDSWTCLMVDKGPGVLDEEVCDTLRIAACDLHLHRFDRMKITGGTCEGVIQTEWTTHVVGSRSGVLFRAQIFVEDGDYFVNFLLHENDLTRGADVLRKMRENGDGAWVRIPGMIPVQELYEFKNLRRKKLN